MTWKSNFGMSKEQSSDEQASTTLNNAILAAMITSKQRHKLLMADRTGDAAWITAAIEHLVAADPTVTLDEIEGALRDAAGSAYMIGTADRFEVVIGMPAWLAALAEARVTAAENRAALGDTHPAVLPK